jgi:protein gp37
MAEKSLIEWTDATWNPWHGCIKVSPGCKNCYMYRGKQRYGKDPRTIIRSRTTFYDPLRWSEPRLIFACSWSDWFIKDADTWRPDAWNVIRATPQHTYQILTKRPERIAQSLPEDWGSGWPNVWLGVSIESQDYIFRKEILRAAPARIRFISAEPLLGPVDFGDLKGIQWLITGGESGPKARPMNPDWARSIRRQCAKSKVAFFHKQNGGRKLIDGTWGGRILDGLTWDAMPRIRPALS